MTELQNKDLKYIFHPCSQMKEFENNPPLIIEKGEGIYLIDENGKKYIDGISSWWVNLFGHANPRINKVAFEQINKLEHVIFASFGHKPAIELCENLIEVLPDNIKKFMFADNGSSAVEMALKLSYQYHLQTGHPNKNKFISLQNAYHGETIGALGVGDVDIFTKTYKPLITEAKKMRVPYISNVLPKEEFEKIEKECILELEEYIKKNHESIASIIVEPMVQGASGMKMYSANYLKAVREITKKYNIHLIDDEIAMGFGRTGKMFACEHAGVKPDIMCLAKGLSTGYYPIALVCITQDIYDAFYDDYEKGKSFLQSHTYSGNPLGCRIALEVLKIFKEENIMDMVSKKSKFLEDKIVEKFLKEDYIKDYRIMGMIGVIELKDSKNPRAGKEIAKIALEKGLLIRPIGNTVYFMPPYVITEKEIEKMLDICKESIEEYLK